MEQRLSALVGPDEVLRSSQVIARLREQGLSAANARQIIRRSAKDDGVWRSVDLRLPRNERLFTTAAFRKSGRFLPALMPALEAAGRRGLARCVDAVVKKKVLHRVDAMRLLAVGPATPRKSASRSAYDDELRGIREIGLTVVYPNHALEALCVAGAERSLGAEVAATSKRLRTELILARVLIERMRQQNMLAWNQIEIPEPENPYVVFNGQPFTATGFSYLSPLVRWQRGSAKPVACPVVIDCHHEMCSPAWVESLLQRMDRASHRGRVRQPMLGVVAATDFESAAFDLARKKGLVVCNMRQQFGNDALATMAELEDLLQGVVNPGSGTQASDLSSITHLLDELKSNPVVSALRAIGFEALTGLIVRSQGYEQVELGRIVPYKQTSRDVDVIGFKADEVRVVECKAYHGRKSVAPGEVTKFFTETVPACKEWLRATGRSFTKCTAEIWTTGRKGKDAGDTMFRLKRPKGDEWAIRRIEEITPLLPHAIKERALQLLNSIATAEIDGSLPES